MEDRSHLLELLEKLEEGTLVLERDQASDRAPLVHRLFQSAHNLKSGLAMAGLPRASKLLHELEDGLDDVRRGRTAWSDAWGDALLDAVDRVKVCLDAGQDDDLDMTFDAPVAAPEAGASGTPMEVEAGLRAVAAGQRLYRIEKLFGPGLGQADFEGHLIYDDIRDSGTLISVTPDWATYAKAEGETVVRFLFMSPQTPEQLSALFFDPLIEVALPTVSAAPGTARFRLLIVEDDHITAEIIRKSLESVAEVRVAYDGLEGAREFAAAFDRGQSFDVVVSDLDMPGASGHEALEAMRREEERRGIYGLDRCLVFMNTASHNFDHVQLSFRLQADGYFLKPLSVTKIKKRLEQSLAWLETRRKGTP